MYSKTQSLKCHGFLCWKAIKVFFVVISYCDGGASMHSELFVHCFPFLIYPPASLDSFE